MPCDQGRDFHPMVGFLTTSIVQHCKRKQKSGIVSVFVGSSMCSRMMVMHTGVPLHAIRTDCLSLDTTHACIALVYIEAAGTCTVAMLGFGSSTESIDRCAVTCKTQRPKVGTLNNGTSFIGLASNYNCGIEVIADRLRQAWWFICEPD